MDYQIKYLKYKNKYLIFKEQIGGTLNIADKQSTFKNACIALFYNKHIFLVLQKDGTWNIPGGHIDPGENSFQAAFREFNEETGGFNLKRWANSSKPRKEFHSHEYHGHTKIWWYVSEEDPKIIFKINNETVKGQWFSVNKLPNLRFPQSIREIITLVSSKL
jgi:8-oxo-dGTP pyrophosphatase MutT (NUDIX family)